MDDRRIYVQLRPDQAGIDALTALQGTLSPTNTGRMLPESELHVTVIHFGKIRDVFESLKRVAPIQEDAYLRSLDTYIAATQQLITDTAYELVPKGIGHFGAHGKTLVIEYDAPESLHIIHQKVYELLIRFFHDCGVQDVDSFIHHDPNFVHAAEFRPHLTLYKGYEGEDPTQPLAYISVRFMKLVY